MAGKKKGHAKQKPRAMDKLIAGLLKHAGKKKGDVHIGIPVERVLYEYEVELRKVVDGDTVDVYADLGFRILYATRLRLAGIDTPELRSTDPEERERAKAARDFLRERLEAANRIWIRTHRDEQGKYGRWLAEIFADDTNMNLLLLTEGHAVPYDL